MPFCSKLHVWDAEGSMVVHGCPVSGGVSVPKTNTWSLLGEDKSGFWREQATGFACGRWRRCEAKFEKGIEERTKLRDCRLHIQMFLFLLMSTSTLHFEEKHVWCPLCCGTTWRLESFTLIMLDWISRIMNCYFEDQLVPMICCTCFLQVIACGLTCLSHIVNIVADKTLNGSPRQSPHFIPGRLVYKFPSPSHP